MQQNRIIWADQVKALGIFVMVMGHFGFPGGRLWEFLAVFYIPIFFLVSGYMDKGVGLTKESFLKCFKSLMVPYFFFSICYFSACWVSPYLHPEIYGEFDLLHTWQKAFVGMLLMQDQVRPFAFMPLGPLWFLVALFWVRVLFSLVVTAYKRVNCIGGGILLIILFTVGYMLDIKYFSLDSAAMGLPLYAGGYMLKRYNLIERVTKRRMAALLFVVGLLYTIFVAHYNGEVGMDGANYGNSILMFYVDAIIASLACIFLFKAIDVKWNWLSVVGASTLTILGTHTYINKVGTTLGVLVLGINPAHEPVWFVLVLTTIAVSIGVGCHKFILKYIPFVLGKKKI